MAGYKAGFTAGLKVRSYALYVQARVGLTRNSTLTMLACLLLQAGAGAEGQVKGATTHLLH